MSSLLCFGHRGAAGHEPENTLRSFARAIELGSHWIELDVYLVQGELLVIHDDSLQRTTNGTGKVTTSRLDYLRSLDAGAGEQIPTLAEVADLVDQRCGINVELKGPDTGIPVSALLNSLCESGWDRQQFLISSFSHSKLARTDPRFRRGPLFHKAVPDYFTRTAMLAAYSINLSRKLVDEKLVTEAHHRDLQVYVYTVNEPEEIHHMIQLGVDGLFSDYPDRVLAVTGTS